MTIKITPISDTHQEFGEYQAGFGEGDVCVLAGDNNVALHLASQNEIILARDMLGRAQRQIAKALETHDHVVMIAGNHEHYAGFFNLTHRILRDKLGSERVHILDKEIWHHKGVDFYGATMWTDLAKGDRKAIDRVHQGMMDYQEIWMHDSFQSPPERKLHPMDTIEDHLQAVIALQEARDAARENSNRLVVVSHHAPSPKSLLPKYQVGGKYAALSPAYYSDLEHAMPGVNLWIHGHMHDSFRYHVGDTEVVCNPCGILGHRLNLSFDPKLSIEV
ncbi:metallophosphoesterase [Stenotrophomonas phage BUCTxx99]|nr:metallophosphoesterase [Stenotrophomonas phage BUCTxx99]